MPEHGTNNCLPEYESDGFFQVTVPSSGLFQTYYIKISDRWDHELCHAFVGPGQTALLGVPTGTHYLKYASGVTWYGSTYLFGPDASYSETSDSFEISPGATWNVELVPQAGGNLGYSSVDYESF